jgi:DNA topoisomerase I
MAKQFIERRKKGKAFEYFIDGETIKDTIILDYIKSLVIPPAWKDVKIAKNKEADILATGIDSAGRLQYIYHPRFRARQDKAKFERILRFARSLPRMRRITGEHLKHTKLNREKVLAAMVRLLDQAYFRVGNDIYAQENQSYGLTTIRSKHTSFRKDTIVFKFTGKSGQQQHKEVTDKQLARILKKLDKLPGYEIFKYYDEEGKLKFVNSNDVNAYIKEVMGEEFTAKDFRTWGGTLYAAAELASAQRSPHAKERQKVVVTCVKNVAKRLGNTPAIARSSYIDPRIIKAYEKDELRKVYETVSKMKRTAYLSADEECVLHTLEQAA